MKISWVLLALAMSLLPTGWANAACPTPTTDQTIPLSGHPFAAEPTADNCYLFVSLIRGDNAGAVGVLANAGGMFRLVRTVDVTSGSGGGLALSHDGTLLAVAAEKAVILFDAAKLKTADQDPVEAVLPEGDRGAIYTQFSKDDRLLFVSEERNASLGVIDVAAARQGATDKAMTGRIPVGEAPVGLALSLDGTRLFSTSQRFGSSRDCKPEQPGGQMHTTGALLSIDVAKAATDPSHAVLGAIKAGCSPVRVVVSADGHALWVSRRGDDHIMGLDPATLLPGAASSPGALIAVGSAPVGLAIRPDGAQLWVSDSDRFAFGAAGLALVTPADPARAQLTGTLKVGAFPRDLRFLPDGRTLVVALFGEQAVMLHVTEDSARAPLPASKR